MESDLLLDLLMAALVIALSPITVIAITLILSTRRARANGLAFTVGWLAGLFAITALFTLLTDNAEEQVNSATRVWDVIRLGIGILLLALAVRKLLKRRAQGDKVPVPGWMQSLDRIGPERAIALGLALAVANPKNLIFTFAAAAAIGGLGLPRSDALIAVLLFVAFASLSVLGSVAFFLAATNRAANGLGRLKDFMTRNNALIMAALYAFFGIKLVVNGVAGLLG